MVELLHGDCLDLMSSQPPQTVDLILCDLPYGVTDCVWDEILPFKRLWELYKHVLKPTGTVLLFGSQPFTSMIVQSNPKDFRYLWYWEKERGTGFSFAKYQPLRKVEEICVFYQGGNTYNPQMVPLDKPYKHALPINKSKSANYGLKTLDAADERQYKTYTHSYPTNVLNFPRESNRKSIHPTQKPVNLLKYLIQTHSKEGDVVLDNCMGSGSTGVAAVECKRSFIGMELNAEYFAHASLRIKDAQDKVLQILVDAC